MAEVSLGERMRLALEALRGRLPQTPSGEAASTETPPAPRADDTTDELARALIACLDVLEADEEAAERARLALGRAGIGSLGAEGERFDRVRHRAQGRVPTDDPSLEWTIASCVSAGWARGEEVLRPAEVWVYRLESAEE